LDEEVGVCGGESGGAGMFVPAVREKLTGWTVRSWKSTVMMKTLRQRLCGGEYVTAMRAALRRLSVCFGHNLWIQIGDSEVAGEKSATTELEFAGSFGESGGRWPGVQELSGLTLAMISLGPVVEGIESWEGKGSRTRRRDVMMLGKRSFGVKAQKVKPVEAAAG
jgi:hypothetical protein